MPTRSSRRFPWPWDARLARTQIGVLRAAGLDTGVMLLP